MTGSQVTRTVKETAKAGSSVGNAVTATDADNDPLLYSLTDGDDRRRSRTAFSTSTVTIHPKTATPDEEVTAIPMVQD